MGEGYCGFAPLESRPAREAKRSLEEAQSQIEKLVAQRWEAIIESLESFREQEAEDALDTETFMAETMAAWEARHEGSERVDTMSPFDRVVFLLGLLIEKGLNGIHKRGRL